MYAEDTKQTNLTPEDIRANKKDGSEYDTIEDAFKKGGIRKIIVLIFAALLAGYLLFGGIAVWLNMSGIASGPL